MDYLPNDSFPRESVELIAVEITRNDVAVTEFELTLSILGARPEDWAAPTVAGSIKGYMLPGDLEPTSYMLWARVTALPEIPVIPVRRITIT